MTNEKSGPRARGTGCLYRRPDSQVWWIKYSRYGKPHRESTGTTDDKKAEKFLLKRLAEIQQGTFIGPKREKIRVEELAGDFLRDYKINKKRSLASVQRRWKLHLKPVFGANRVIDITSDRIQKYVDARQGEGAANATINRELAALKRMFHLGEKATPPKVLRIPAFPHLEENNIRQGFLEDGQYRKLIDYAKNELWFHALIECGRTYGWRRSELLNLRVNQVDLAHRVRCSNGSELQGMIRLEPGTTKNKSGREVVMTPAVYTLLQACVSGKESDDAVFTRKDGTPVREFRKTWYRACDLAGVGKLLCRQCSKQTHGDVCECGWKESKYEGLLFHDLRRTAARNLRRKRNGESVIMKVGGWKTASVFRRYDIVDPSDIADAAASLVDTPVVSVKTQEDPQGSESHDSGHVGTFKNGSTNIPATQDPHLTFVASAN